MKDHEVTNQKAPDERETFEAWVRASGRSHMLERESEHGWYENLTITAWWTAWQARAALAAQDERLAFVLDHLRASDDRLESLVCCVHDSDGFPLQDEQAIAAIDAAIRKCKVAA